ncbi:HMG-box [Moniliophthora roreri]|nr:HMG-box [Moniliophthora roreri]
MPSPFKLLWDTTLNRLIGGCTKKGILGHFYWFLLPTLSTLETAARWAKGFNPHNLLGAGG